MSLNLGHGLNHSQRSELCRLGQFNGIGALKPSVCRRDPGHLRGGTPQLHYLKISFFPVHPLRSSFPNKLMSLRRMRVC